MNILSKKEILCTLGPSSMNDWVIKRLESLGVSLFRVNLSHTKIDDLPKVIRKIQGYTSVPICLDTEGAQIRTGNLLDGKVMVKENSTIRISKIPVDGDGNVFNLNRNTFSGLALFNLAICNQNIIVSNLTITSSILI